METNFFHSFTDKNTLDRFHSEVLVNVEPNLENTLIYKEVDFYYQEFKKELLLMPTKKSISEKFFDSLTGDNFRGANNMIIFLTNYGLEVGSYTKVLILFEEYNLTSGSYYNWENLSISITEYNKKLELEYLKYKKEKLSRDKLYYSKDYSFYFFSDSKLPINTILIIPLITKTDIYQDLYLLQLQIHDMSLNISNRYDNFDVDESDLSRMLRYKIVIDR